LAEHAAASVTPMEDHCASADYRIALTKVLVERVFKEALGNARQRGGRLQ
jgi:CO/xanthine dehydrogenase FAD-binding subunit